MTDINKTLGDRQLTHGSYKVQASISQQLKEVVSIGVEPLPMPTQREAIDMILHKIARIHSGNPMHIDHWHDIAGYATLVVTELEKAQDIQKGVKDAKTRATSSTLGRG